MTKRLLFCFRCHGTKKIPLKDLNYHLNCGIFHLDCGSSHLNSGNFHRQITQTNSNVSSARYAMRCSLRRGVSSITWWSTAPGSNITVRSATRGRIPRVISRNTWRNTEELVLTFIVICVIILSIKWGSSCNMCQGVRRSMACEHMYHDAKKKHYPPGNHHASHL